VGGDAPLDPTSAEARELLEKELGKAVYRDDRGLLERLWDWLRDNLTGTTGSGGLPAWTVWLAVFIGFAVLALVLFRSIRAERRMTGPRHEGVLAGPVRSGAEHRATAAAALAAGDADTAVLEGYRALTRSAVDRTLLEDLPGLTAHEVSVALGPVFPGYAGRLASAADAFDAVRYGRRPATLSSATELVELDLALLGSRPLLPEPVAPQGGLS
jgi:hypothetical protein